MNEILKVLDVVALTEDVPSHQLRRGQVGTVVEVYEGIPWRWNFWTTVEKPMRSFP